MWYNTSMSYTQERTCRMSVWNSKINKGSNIFKFYFIRIDSENPDVFEMKGHLRYPGHAWSKSCMSKPLA